MWNDLFESLPYEFFFSVNEFDPIDNEVNDVNPSIVNDETLPKQLLPILNEFSKLLL